MGLDGKTWEPDARRQDPVLYSVCDTVDLCDKHGGAESRPKYEAVTHFPQAPKTGSHFCTRNRKFPEACFPPVCCEFED